MQIDEAVYRDGCLVLRSSDADARRFAYRFESGNYEIEKAKKRRSNDANNFAWSIIGKIASAMQIDRLTIYTGAIRAVGASESIAIRKDAYDGFARVWESRGLGWVCDLVDESDNFYYVNCYYGSSSYDSKQMSQLIDYLKQDAESIGINVDSEQVKSLLEDWELSHG